MAAGKWGTPFLERFFEQLEELLQPPWPIVALRVGSTRFLTLRADDATCRLTHVIYKAVSKQLLPASSVVSELAQSGTQPDCSCPQTLHDNLFCPQFQRRLFSSIRRDNHRGGTTHVREDAHQAKRAQNRGAPSEAPR